MAEIDKGRSDVVVVGVAAMDMVARVDKLPQPDDLVLAQQFEYSPGGAGANVAAALSRLGCETVFLGRVGDDENGRLLIQSFKDAGVMTDMIGVDQGLSTPTCFITVSDSGERTIIALGNATIISKAEELNLDVIHQAKALYLSDVDGELVCTAAREAHRGGATVFYGPGGWIVSKGVENLAPLLKDVDVLLVSRTEAEILAPGAAPEAATRALLQMGVPIVVQTVGAEGVLVGSEDNTVHIPASAVQNIVDTTGAGDAFAAGLIAGHLEGKSWASAARVGGNVASFKIGHLGARSGIPSRADLAALEDK